LESLKKKKKLVKGEKKRKSKWKCNLTWTWQSWNMSRRKAAGAVASVKKMLGISLFTMVSKFGHEYL